MHNQPKINSESIAHTFRVSGMLWLYDLAGVKPYCQCDEYDSYAREIVNGPRTWDHLAAVLGQCLCEPDAIVSQVAEYLDILPPVPAEMARVNGTLYAIADHPRMPAGDHDVSIPIID